MRRVGSLLVLSFAFLPSVVLAQGSITGKVSDAQGAPLARAMVSAEGSGLSATTNDQGRYEIRGVAPGTYTMRVRLLGYLPQSARVIIGQTAVVQDFTLAVQAISLSPVDVVVGSRAHHTAGEQLAVPVDEFTSQDIAQQGTNETSQILQNLAPSVNFPRQSVTDANDIVRPFTMRGLSPDHTLVLLNGWRRHQMAVMNTFAYGMGAGSSGVDLNALPGSAIDRIEVLRDGAAAQYGSDAIAGVVNVVLKEGGFSPFVNGSVGQYSTDNTSRHINDGTTADVNGGYGVGLGHGSLAVFGEYLHRDPTNRAWADSFPLDPSGKDVVDPATGRVIQKVNAVPQPNYHWGDGLEKDAMGFANFRMPLNPGGTSEVYAFGGYSHRDGTGNGFWRYFDSNRNWQELYPHGFLPQFHPMVIDFSGVGGFRANVSGWSLDVGGSYGKNRFDYDLEHTNNASLGPCLVTPCAPGADGILGTADDPGIPNQESFFAGRLERTEAIAAINLANKVNLGLSAPVNVALGAAYRHEDFKITAGEKASWINGNHLGQDSAGADGIFGTADDKGPAPAGSSVFPGFA
ncbi:MAG TPA: TonB-dependent receptor, partial [Gemmatimonadales bacterium]|nr:TonB-dependent receptor [Gemmatimonadales bacterium]